MLAVRQLPKWCIKWQIEMPNFLTFLTFFSDNENVTLILSVKIHFNFWQYDRLHTLGVVTFKINTNIRLAIING